MSTIRRFLVASSLSRLIRKERGASRVTEGYFPNHPGRSSHVQVEGGSCSLILITSSNGGLPVEEHTEVPRAHADALLDVAPGKVVYDRSRMNLSGREIFVDRFSLPGPLDLISVAFDSEEEAREFRPPQWFGNEVTNEQVYQYRSIALEGAPTPQDAPLSNAALEALLDAFENRFGTSRRQGARPQAASQQPAPEAQPSTVSAAATPILRPTDGGAKPEAQNGAGESESIEDDVIRELARALGR